jgi:hypothetical protein
MTYLNTEVMYSPKRGSDRNLLFKGAARWRPVSGPRARRGRAGQPDRGVPGLAACLLVGRGGVFGDLERLSRGKTDAGGGRAGQTTATSGADGVISRALGGTDFLIMRRDPLQRGRIPGTPYGIRDRDEWGTPSPWRAAPEGGRPASRTAAPRAARRPTWRGKTTRWSG